VTRTSELRVVQGGRASEPPPEKVPRPAPIPVIAPPRRTGLWLAAGILVSLAVHAVFVYIAVKAPQILRQREDTIVKMLVVEQAEPEPEPEAEPEPEPEPEPEEIDFQDAVVSVEPPPADAQPAKTEPQAPVFGASMSSTVSGGGSWSVTVGNSVGLDPEHSAPPEELDPAAPVVTYERIDREPVVIRRHEPPYPEEAKLAGIEGDVLLYLTIDASGDVTAVQVVSGPHPDLDEAARAAMFKHKFKPALKDGRPVTVKRYPYYFTWIIEE